MWYTWYITATGCLNTILRTLFCCNCASKRDKNSQMFTLTIMARRAGNYPTQSLLIWGRRMYEPSYCIGVSFEKPYQTLYAWLYGSRTHILLLSSSISRSSMQHEWYVSILCGSCNNIEMDQLTCPLCFPNSTFILPEFSICNTKWWQILDTVYIYGLFFVYFMRLCTINIWLIWAFTYYSMKCLFLQSGQVTEESTRKR
jgi:hypothetical protein